MITLLFPEGLFALVVLCPLLLFLISSWLHEREVLRVFLLKVRPKVFIAELIALTVAVVFIAFTLARPVSFVNETDRIRFAKNTEVLLVFDVSRSMLAQKEPYGQTRLERAKAMGRNVTQKLDMKIGVAGLSDIIMVHLFPTKDLQAVLHVINETVQIESVPFGYSATGRLDALTDYAGFFSTDSKNKIIIVFTDGDMPVLSSTKDTDILRASGVVVFFVGIGAPGELIYKYDPEGKLTGIDPHVTNFRRDVLLKSADIVGGKYFDEGDSAELVNTVKKVAGEESIIEEVTEHRTAIELTPITALMAFTAIMFFLYLRRPI